jgi:hypothetical protein
VNEDAQNWLQPGNLDHQICMKFQMMFKGVLFGSIDVALWKFHSSPKMLKTRSERAKVKGRMSKVEC